MSVDPHPVAQRGARDRARRAARVAGLVVALLLLGEIAARLALPGPGPVLEPVAAGHWQGTRLHPEVARRYFPPLPDSLMPRPGFAFFDRAATADRYRILCLGGTLASGYPYPPHGAFPALLDVALQALLPEVRVEVINGGLRALGSAAVVDLGQTLLSQEVDLIVLACGAEEYFGATGVAARRARSSAGSAALEASAAERLGLVRLARYLAAGNAPGTLPAGAGLYTVLAATHSIAPTSPLRDAAREALARRVGMLARAARESETRLLICEPVSADARRPPFDPGGEGEPRAAGDAERGSDDRRARLRAALDAARAARARGDTSAAWAAAQRAVEADSTHAGARFLSAELLAARGATAAARRAYRAARDYDRVPLRAETALREALREVARQEGAAYLPLDSLFWAAARGPGEAPLFLTPQHPSIRGHALVANAIARALHARAWIAPPDRWRWDAAPSWQACARLAGITPLDTLLASERVRRLRQRWPYASADTPPSPSAPPPRGTTPAVADSVPGAEIAAFHLAGRFPLHAAHNWLAIEYERAERFAEALREFRASTLVYPLDPAPALDAAEILLAVGRGEYADWFLRRALFAAPDFEPALLLSAERMLATGDTAAATAAAHRVLARNPASVPARTLLERTGAAEEMR